MTVQILSATVGLGLDEAGINEDRDLLQEMRMAMTAHRIPSMDHASVPTAMQVFPNGIRTRCRHDSVCRRDRRLQAGLRFDAFLVDGEMIYRDGQFLKIDRDDILAQIAAALAKSRSTHERSRLKLSQDVFSHVEASYADYLKTEPLRAVL